MSVLSRDLIGKLASEVFDAAKTNLWIHWAQSTNCVGIVTPISFTDMTDFDHEACEFFDLRCRERGITPQRIRESRRPNVRRPDFALQINGKTVIVEVKAIEPNEQDQDDLEKMGRQGSVLRDGFSDTRRISNKLKKADGQLKPYAERSIPGIVNIQDYTGYGLLLVSYGIHVAMFGRDKLQVSVPRDWRDYTDSPPPPRIEGLRSAGRETLTQQHNRSISAVLIFHFKRLPATFVSCLFHNHFARHSIPPECAARFVDYQYKSREREGDLGDPWVEIPLGS